MPNKQKTIEEVLIELDAADTQLSNEAARVIRELSQKLRMTFAEIEDLHQELDALK